MATRPGPARRRRTRRSAHRSAAVLLAALLVAGCDAGAAPSQGGFGNGGDATLVPDAAYRAGIDGALGSLDAYWATAFSSVAPGLAYRPMTADRVLAYLPGQAPALPAGCDVTAQVAVGNAFHCGGAIAFDDDFLYRMSQAIGLVAPQVVLAHEFGHYVQFLASSRNEYDVQDELQADCYAGAWAGHVVGRGEVSAEATWAAALTFRRLGDDQDRGTPGPAWFDSQAHGRSTERAQAFALGMLSAGPAACAELAAFQRLERVELGNGVALELMQGVSVEPAPGYAILDYAGRGLPTRVEVRFDPALAVRTPDDILAGIGDFLPGRVTLLDTRRSAYQGAQSLRVTYQQEADGIVLHGVLLIALTGDGGIVMDAYADGAAPDLADDAAWGPVVAVLFATQTGLYVPGGAT